MGYKHTAGSLVSSPLHPRITEMNPTTAEEMNTGNAPLLRSSDHPLLLLGLPFTIRTPVSAGFREGGARGGDGVDIEDVVSGAFAGLLVVWMAGLMGRMGRGRPRPLSREGAGADAAFVGARRDAGMMDPATGLGGSEGCPGKDAPTPAPALAPLESSAAAAVVSSCRSFASMRAILASVLQRTDGLRRADDGKYTSAGHVRVRSPRTRALEHAERRGLADVADRPAILGRGALRARSIEGRLVRIGHDELAPSDELVVRVCERLLRVLASSDDSSVSCC